MSRKSAAKLLVVLSLGIALPGLVRASDSTEAAFQIRLPLGIPYEIWSYFIPNDNPMVLSKIELGRKLFFDQNLSADGTVSCASCHDPKRAFTDGRKVAEGISGRTGTRNSPTLLNAMFNGGQFWDGRASTLEEQARMPLINPDEMGNASHADVVTRLAANPEYVNLFKASLGSPVTIDGIAKAIAAYERTLVSADSPVDRFLGGDLNALSESARNGLVLFRSKARCGVCHAFNQNFSTFASFPFFTDMNYRNTGVAANFNGFDGLARQAMAASRDDSGRSMLTLIKHERAGELGRFAISGNTLDIGAFRTPSLRNIELTAPYFHDGSAATLEDVVKFYVKGGQANPNRDWQLEPVPLAESEQHDLVEFLKSLTSDEARRLSRPN